MTAGKTILSEKIVQFQKPLYSFGVVSDVHIDRTNQDAQGDLRKAFSAFRNRGITRVFCCGDISTNHTEDELAIFKSIKDEYPEITFRSCTGNHDVQFTEQQWQTYIGHEFTNGQNQCMYTEEINGDVFCLLPIRSWEDARPYSSGMGDDPFDEFHQALTNDLSVGGKRVFMFLHYPVNSNRNDWQYTGLKPGQFYGFGDGSKDNVIIKNVPFLSISQGRCKSVVMFSGHSHYAFDVQSATSDFKNVIFRQDDFAHVHVPSLVVPRDQNMNVIHSGHPDQQPAQGYVVDVYPDYVKLTGLEFNLRLFDADQRKGLVRLDNRYVAECGGTRPVPDEYQPLEFVNANGKTWTGDTKPLDNSAYINTGILPSTDLRVYTTITLGNNPGQWQALIGSTSYAEYAWPLWSIRYYNDIKTDFTKPNNAQHSEFSVQISDKTDIQIEYDARRLSVNGIVQEDTSITDYTETENYPIIIGGIYHWTSDIGARAGTLALYKRTKFVKISTGEVLGDFFPVKCKDTGICGFFDIVKQQFHSSLNSIPFTENGF